MLEDRDYMRQRDYRELRVSFTVALLIINAIVFLIECVACGYPPLFSTNNYFALSVGGLKQGFVWQLLTYQFMHAGLLHILLNCWVIYVFGREIEETLGPKKFLTLFLASGVIGGLLQTAAGWLWPHYFGGAVVGASAGAFGLVAAFAILFPERQLTLLLFFILPLTLRARTLLILSAVLALLGIAFPISNIANAAHLGGMLTGVFFALQFSRGEAGRDGNFRCIEPDRINWLSLERAKANFGVPARMSPVKICPRTSL
jgi:membrane associated rhomboid family serine protease